MNIVRVKTFFKKPKVIIWMIVAVFFISLAVLVPFVYAKDMPKFIPEETRKEIGEGVFKAVAEPIGRVLPNLKTVIVNAAWTKDKKENAGNSCGHEAGGNGKKDTKNWPTYVDEETGVSFKYPEGWSVTQGDIGVFSFSPDEDSYDRITIYKSSNFQSVDEYWNNYIKNWDAVIDEVDIVEIKGNSFYVFKQLDGMMETHYITKISDVIFDLVPGGSGYDFIEAVASSM